MCVARLHKRKLSARAIQTLCAYSAIHDCRLKTLRTACCIASSKEFFYFMNYFELNLLAMKTKKWFLIGTAIAGVYLFMH